MLAYAAGNEVRLVELLSGEQRMGLSLNAPVRTACLFDNGLVNVVDAGGTLTSYLIMEGSSTGLIPNSTIQVAEGEYASLTKVGKVYYAAVWDPETDRYRVYQCVLPTKDVAGYEMISGLNGLKLWFSGGPHKEYPEKTPFVVKSDTEIGVLDQDSFKLRWTIQKAALGLGESFDMTTAAGHLYAYTTWSVNNECVVLELSWETGEVINRYVFPCDEYGWIGINKIRVFDFDGVTTLVLAVNGSKYIWCLSLEDLTPMACVGPLVGTVVDFYLVNDVVTVAYQGSPHGYFETYQLADGALVSNDLRSLAPAFTNNASRYVAFSWDSDLMLVCCADGYLRCLDTKSWNVIWEQEVDNVQIAAFSMDERYVLVQDTTGTCVMLNAKTGETLRASSVTLPLINFFVYDPSDPTRIDATCVYSSLSISEFYFVSFSLDDDAFGPTALIRFGAASSSSRDKVLSYDMYQDIFGVQHLHTLDELIALGHEQLQGHELTDVERQLLRIDE